MPRISTVGAQRREPRRGVHFSLEEEGTWRVTVCSSAPGLPFRTFSYRQTSQDLDETTCLVCLRLMVRSDDLVEGGEA
jgi:hypothetical protein